MQRMCVALACAGLGACASTPEIVVPPPPQEVDLGQEDQRDEPLSQIAEEAFDDLEFTPLYPAGIYTGSASERSHLSGDWGGARTELARNGMLVDFVGVLVGSSVFDGGNDEDEELLQKADLVFKFDTDRAGLWPGGFGSVRTEARFGDSSNPDAGTLMPVDTVALFPAANAEDDTLDLTEAVVTQFLTEQISVFGGLVQTLDGDQVPGASGRGTWHFLNTALVVNPVTLQAIPYSTLGVGLGLFPTPNNYGIFLVMDTEESSGKNKLDETGGTTVSGEWYTTYDVGDCLGGFMVGGLWADHDFVNFDQDPRNFLAPAGLDTDDDSWAVWANLFQSFVPAEPDRFGSRRTWGGSVRLGTADDETNPFEWYASVTLHGRSTFSSRPLDRWGIGYYHLGLTDQDIVDALPVSDENGVEAFYSFAVLPSVRVTLDLQFVDTGFDDLDDVWVGQVRTTVQL